MPFKDKFHLPHGSPRNEKQGFPREKTARSGQEAEGRRAGNILAGALLGFP